MLRFSWMIINFLLGCALGGLLIAGYFGVNTMLPVVVAGFIGGALHLAAWWYTFFQKDAGSLNKYKRWRTSLVVIQVLIGVSILSVFLVQRYQFTNHPVLTVDRSAEFIKLWRAMDKAYPYFEEKNIDWQAIYQEYSEKVVTASSDEQYFDIMGRMIGELQDAHSHLIEPLPQRKAFGTVIDKGGLAVVDLVGRSGEAAGLVPGMVVLAVENVPVDEYIETIDLAYDNASTPGARRIRALNDLLLIPEDETLSLDVIDQSGVFQSLEIVLLPPTTDATTKNSGTYTPQPSIAWKRMEGDIGYIQVNRLSNREGDDVISQFDQALAQLMDTRGLILDLRNNGGGDSRIGDQVVARFLSEPFTYGYEEYPVRLYQHIWRQKTTYQVSPRGDTYLNPLVVLIDYQVMSSAEMMLAALVDSGRAFTIGRPTGGSSGNPIRYQLSGGQVQFSTGAFYRMNGQLVEGNGFQPDITVFWDVQEYIHGLDPDIEDALDWINAQ